MIRLDFYVAGITHTQSRCFIPNGFALPVLGYQYNKYFIPKIKIIQCELSLSLSITVIPINTNCKQVEIYCISFCMFDKHYNFDLEHSNIDIDE